MITSYIFNPPKITNLVANNQSLTETPGSNTVTFTFTTENFNDGDTILWSNTGTSSSYDFNGSYYGTDGETYGSLTVNNNTASIDLTVKEDWLSEGTETIVMNGYMAYQDPTGEEQPIISRTVNISDTSGPFSVQPLNISGSILSEQCSPGGGNVSIQVSGGNPPYIFSRSLNGAAYEEIQFTNGDQYSAYLDPGDWRFKVTDTAYANYNGDEQIKEITSVAVDGIDFTLTDITTNSATISVTGPGASYSLNFIAPDVNIENIGGGVFKLTNLSAETQYNATIKEERDSSDTVLCSRAVEFNTLSAIDFTLVGGGQECGANSKTYTVSDIEGGNGTNSYEVTWYHQNGSLVSGASGTSATLNAGTYYVKVNDVQDISNYKTSEEFTVVEKNIPTGVTVNTITKTSTEATITLDGNATISSATIGSLPGNVSIDSNSQISMTGLSPNTSYSASVVSNEGCSNTFSWKTYATDPTNITHGWETIGPCKNMSTLTITSTDAGNQYQYPYTVTIGQQTRTIQNSGGSVTFSLNAGTSYTYQIESSNQDGTIRSINAGSPPQSSQVTGSGSMDGSTLKIVVGADTNTAWTLNIYENGNTGAATTYTGTGDVTVDHTLEEGKTYTYTIIDEYGCNGNHDNNTYSYVARILPSASISHVAKYDVGCYDGYFPSTVNEIRIDVGPTTEDYTVLLRYARQITGYGSGINPNIQQAAHSESKTHIFNDFTGNGVKYGDTVIWKVEIFSTEDFSTVYKTLEGSFVNYKYRDPAHGWVGGAGGTVIKPTSHTVIFNPTGVQPGYEHLGYNPYKYPINVKLLQHDNFNNPANVGGGTNKIEQQNFQVSAAQAGNYEINNLIPEALYELNVTDDAECSYVIPLGRRKLRYLIDSGITLSNGACYGDTGSITVAPIIKYHNYPDSPFDGQWKIKISEVGSNSIIEEQTAYGTAALTALNVEPGTYKVFITAAPNDSVRYNSPTEWDQYLDDAIVYQREETITISASTQITVTEVIGLDTATITAEGGTGQLEMSHTPDITVTRNGNTWNMTGLNHGTSYEYTIKDQNGCGTNNQRGFTTLTCPDITSDASTQTFLPQCGGESTGRAIITLDTSSVTGNISYEVLGGPGAQNATVTITKSGQQDTIKIEDLAPGNYSVRVKSYENKCEEFVNFEIADVLPFNAQITGVTRDYIYGTFSNGVPDNITAEVNYIDNSYPMPDFEITGPSSWRIGGFQTDGSPKLIENVGYRIVIADGNGCAIDVGSRTPRSTLRFYKTQAFDKRDDLCSSTSINTPIYVDWGGSGTPMINELGGLAMRDHTGKKYTRTSGFIVISTAQGYTNNGGTTDHVYTMDSAGLLVYDGGLFCDGVDGSDDGSPPDLGDPGDGEPREEDGIDGAGGQGDPGNGELSDNSSGDTSNNNPSEGGGNQNSDDLDSPPPGGEEMM